MSIERSLTHDVPQRLGESWPPAQWRDVHVLAAVSGGADSMALLAALVEAKRRHGGAGRIYAGHVNHRLRDDASDADQRWLEGECERMGAPLLVRSCDTMKLAAAEGDGVEAAARSARYRLLTEMAESVGARYVAMAHTRDDQIETSLFQLLRGAGLRGLAGMTFSRALSPSVALVRPLLQTQRSELREYLNSIGQGHREDASNDDPRFARNRVRLELLPYLREHFNPEVDQAIGRAADFAREAERLIADMGRDLLAKCQPNVLATGDGVTLQVGPLVEQPEALLVREALRAVWRQAGFGEQAMSRRCWRQLAELACGPEDSAALNLPGGIRAWREGTMLALRPSPPAPLPGVPGIMHPHAWKPHRGDS